MTTTRSVLAVVNVAAGSAERAAVTAACDALDGSCELEVTETRSSHDLDAAIADLDGRDLLVVGGDGSVHLAVTSLRRAGLLAATRVGIVPLGTGNDLARTLGLPLEPGPAARVAVEGRDRTLDLLVDEVDGIAVNAVHAGIGAEAARRSAGTKDGLGTLAYPLGALSAGIAVDGWRVTVTLDGRSLAPADADGVLMVAVGNGRTVGGGTPLLPDAEPDDGLLDVLVCTAIRPAARAAFGVALVRGQHPARDDVVVARGREVAVEGASIPYNVDGELSGEAGERRLRVEPGAWTVRVPA